MPYKKPLKILYVTHSPIIGGAELSLISHLKTLNKEEFETYVIGSRLIIPYLKEIPNITPIEMEFYLLHRFNPMVLVNYGKMVWNILNIVRKYNIDIIHTNSVKTHYIGSIVALLSGKRLIWWIRDTTFNKRLYKILHRIPWKIVSISNYVRDFYIPEEKNMVIYNGSNIYKENVLDEDIRRLKTELNISEHDFVIGTVERLVRWKGVQNLITACYKVRKEGLENFKCIIVGSGKGQEENYEVKLKNLVKKYNLKDNVMFLGQRKDIAILMKVFEVFIHPVIEPEPFGLVVLESMMSKCLVICSNLGGPSEFIENGKTGILFNPKSLRDLSDKLLLVMNEKVNKNEIISDAYNYAVNNLTQEIETRKIEQIYLER